MTIQNGIQKGKVKKPLGRKHPNEKTMYAYYMQAIEPNSKAINDAFPEYHPMWLIKSQQKTVSAKHFKYMREVMLGMTREECGAFLRASECTLRNWESGKSPVPFMAFELLRLVYESAHFKMSHSEWQGWFISDDGRLVSPDRGNLSFSPSELSFIRETHTANAIYQAENTRLLQENETLRKEIHKYKVVHLSNKNNKTNSIALEEKAA